MEQLQSVAVKPPAAANVQDFDGEPVKAKTARALVEKRFADNLTCTKDLSGENSVPSGSVAVCPFSDM